MPDALAPLAAAIITREIEPDKRVLCTAAAALIESPLGLGPSIVALTKARSEGGGKTVDVAGPEMVQVPLVTGLKKDEALTKLKQAKLDASVALHDSAADKANLVFSQDPGQDKWVTVGSTVKLGVHNGPAPPGEKSLTELVTELCNQVAGLRADLAKYGGAPTATPASDATSKGTDSASADPNKKPGS
ncbi:MAG TPA: PASTA domain-containing protein [Allosphingosinicella sp.]|nr:PASTA domain-containing protein [Allosphingosinicella sp.]